MSPSAPLTLPSQSSLPAFFEEDGVVRHSNGHSTSHDRPPVIVAQPKLPGKSNLKRHSRFLNPRQQHHLNPTSIRLCTSFAGHASVDVGTEPMSLIEDPKNTGESYDLSSGTRVCNISEADNFPCNRKDCRVTWTDNQGKDLAEVWEFEPRFRILYFFKAFQVIQMTNLTVTHHNLVHALSSSLDTGVAFFSVFFCS